MRNNEEDSDSPSEGEEMGYTQNNSLSKVYQFGESSEGSFFKTDYFGGN